MRYEMNEIERMAREEDYHDGLREDRRNNPETFELSPAEQIEEQRDIEADRFAAAEEDRQKTADFLATVIDSLGTPSDDDLFSSALELRRTWKEPTK